MGFKACSTNPLFPWSSDKTKWESSPVNYTMNNSLYNLIIIIILYKIIQIVRTL